MREAITRRDGGGRGAVCLSYRGVWNPVTTGRRAWRQPTLGRVFLVLTDHPAFRVFLTPLLASAYAKSIFFTNFFLDK